MADADDAVQDTWLRASGQDLALVENPTGWLTTVVSRICLDMLKARRRAEGLWQAKARFASALLVDGTPGLIVAPLGRLRFALKFTISGGHITAFEVVGEAGALIALDLRLFPP